MLSVFVPEGIIRRLNNENNKPRDNKIITFLAHMGVFRRIRLEFLLEKGILNLSVLTDGGRKSIQIYAFNQELCPSFSQLQNKNPTQDGELFKCYRG